MPVIVVNHPGELMRSSSKKLSQAMARVQEGMMYGKCTGWK